jgi:hypothetical protein
MDKSTAVIGEPMILNNLEFVHFYVAIKTINILGTVKLFL